MTSSAFVLNNIVSHLLWEKKKKYVSMTEV